MKLNLFLALIILPFLAAANVNQAHRIILFGDSLSDQGTYLNFAGQYGGGKFTTNPGKLWIELISENLKLNISANRLDGFNQPVQILGGFNFAQGGARVTNTVGNGSDKGYSARPLTEQITYFVDANTNFKSDDLVFFQGGANDVFMQLTSVSQGQTTPADAVKAMAQTASEFVALIKKSIDLGAKNIVVLNLPQIEKTPKIILMDPKVQGLVSMMTTTFNDIIAKGLANTSEVTLVDIYSFDKKFNTDFAKYGFTNITTSACAMDKLPAKTSLVCTEQTLVSADAQTTYKFADAIHPTTGFSKVIADFILGEIKK
jgi:phospholipase/lecithinase/hemolysin